MAFTIGILVFLVGILVSIGIHELGHMIPAKKFGVRVSQYMIGFGPTLWSREKGETEYGLKAIPLGGYVRLVGMIPPADEVKPVRGTGWAARLIEDTRLNAVEEIREGEEHRAFYRLAWWKRWIVMFSGPFTNLLIAIVLFTGIGTFFGLYTQVPTVAEVVPCTIPATLDRDCAAGDPPSAATAAGLEAGDRIISFDGRDVESWDALTAYVRAHPGETVVLGIERGGETLAINLTPSSAVRPLVDTDGLLVLDEAGEPVYVTVGFMGILPEVERVHQSLTYGITETVKFLGLSAEAVWHLPQSVSNSVQALLGTEERNPNGGASIVGAGRWAGEIATGEAGGATIGDRVSQMLFLLALVNLSLFVFNMLPLLPLDGGHMVGAVWQGIKDAWARLRKIPRAAPVDLARTMPAAYAVFFVLLAVGLILTAADIFVPITAS